VGARLWTVLVLAIVGALLPFVPFVREMEEKSIDARFALRGPRNSRAPVVVVAVDDETERHWREAKKLPKVAWPGEFAGILETAMKGGAKKVAFDFEFAFDIDDFLSMKGVDETPFFTFVDTVGGFNEQCIIGSANPDGMAAQLSAASPTVASVNRVDGDSRTARRLPRVDNWIEDGIPGLAYSIAGAQPGRTDPVDINYTGTEPRIVSAMDVAAGKVPPATFDGAYVLVGETYQSSPDQHDTPLQAQVPGVLIQAEAVRTLLDGTELTVLGNVWGVGLTALVAVLTALLALRVWPFLYGLISLSFMLLWSGLSLVAFSKFYVVVPVIPIGLMALLLVPATVYTVRAVEESRGRLFARAQWGQMVSEAFVKRVEESRKRGLGSWERIEACLLFLDIADFSSHSNIPEQELVVEKLNLLFPMIIGRVRSAGGEVLNFMGDGLAAMWEVGAGAPRETTLTTALQTSLQILREVDRLNASHAFGQEPWDVRIGLAYGEVTLALVGSQDRKQMTLYGPAVNLASRCEQAGKDLVPGSKVTSRLVATEVFREAFKAVAEQFERVEYRARGWTAPLALYYFVEARA